MQCINAAGHCHRRTIGGDAIGRNGRRLADFNRAGLIQVQTTAAHIGAEIGDFCLQVVAAAADCGVRIQAQRIGINVRSAVGIVQHRTVQREQADRAPVGLIRQHRWATVAADPRIEQAQGNVAISLYPDIAAMGLHQAAAGHAQNAASL